MKTSVLDGKISRIFDAAKASGSLISIAKTTHRIHAGSVLFDVSFAPSLARKPTLANTLTDAVKEQKPQSKPKVFNPFLPPERSLVVSMSLQPRHNLLLNKFCVSPHHLLVTTAEYEEQGLPLNDGDFTALLRVLASSLREYVVFYNSGPSSGASQPHKHVQMLPRENGHNGHETWPPIAEAIVNRRMIEIANDVVQSSELPFTHYLVMTPWLRSVINSLRTSTVNTDEIVEAPLISVDEAMQRAVDPLSTQSYNFVMTADFMMLVPRSSSEFTLPSTNTTSNEVQLTTIGINSVGYAGMILVKTKEALDVLETSVNPMNILTQLGIPLEPKSPLSQL
ncbi:hypothetical protein GQ42DRAFT_120908 [Ramicandelaber brevisporus]|nr:hypothetical protein GQ42DRAFT_120908 [Ramicandelaber brevisporus]